MVVKVNNLYSVTRESESFFEINNSFKIGNDAEAETEFEENDVKVKNHGEQVNLKKEAENEYKNTDQMKFQRSIVLIERICQNLCLVTGGRMILVKKSVKKLNPSSKTKTNLNSNDSFLDQD